MRWTIIAILAAGGCTDQANHLGNPLLLPLSGITTGFENAIYNQRRGKVEVFVKSHFDSLIPEITAGGGPTLEQAFDIAGVPVSDRPARMIQLQSDIAIYANAPGALVTALMVYST